MAMALRTLIGRLNAGRAHSPGSEPTLGAPLSAATG
jgi:hypothetical protein